MLQIRELLWGLLLIGCAGKKRSLSSCFLCWIICGGRRPSHAAPGAASSGRRHPCARFRTARPSCSFTPGQTNFRGDRVCSCRYQPARSPGAGVQPPPRPFASPGCCGTAGRPGSRSHLTFCAIWPNSETRARCMSAGAGGGNAEADRPSATLYCRHTTKTAGCEQQLRVTAQRSGPFGPVRPGMERRRAAVASRSLGKQTKTILGCSFHRRALKLSRVRVPL